MQYQTAYLRQVLNARELCAIIKHAPRVLSPIDFYAFAVCGNSGTLLGGALAAALGKGIILVRKPHDNAHSYLPVECRVSDLRKFVFLDDCVDSGATRVHTLRAIKTLRPSAQCIGQYLWRNHAKMRWTPRAQWVQTREDIMEAVRTPL